MSNYVFSVIDSNKSGDSFDFSLVILNNVEFEGKVFRYDNVELKSIDGKVGFVYGVEVSYLDSPGVLVDKKEERLYEVAGDLFEQVMRVFMNAAKKSGEYPDLISLLDT